MNANARSRRSDEGFKTLALFFRSILVVFFIAVLVGVAFSWAFALRSYDGDFAQLDQTGTKLSQQLYEETRDRSAKDSRLMAQQQQTRQTFDDDVASRIDVHARANATTRQSREERLVRDAALAADLNATSQMRQLLDDRFIDWIANATAMLDQFRAFDQFAMDQCQLKMDNITDITADILNETAVALAADDDLRDVDTQIFQALVQLSNQLHDEVENRTAKDMVLMDNLFDITNNLIRTVNAQIPIAGDIVLESVNPPLVRILNGTSGPNAIAIDGRGVLSLKGVRARPNGTLSIRLGQGLESDVPSPHTLRVNLTEEGNFQPGNLVRLSHVYPYGQESSTVQSGTGLVGGLSFRIFTHYVMEGPQTQCIGADDIIGQPCTTTADCPAPGAFCIPSGGGGGIFPFPTLGFVANRCSCNSCFLDQECQDAYGPAWQCMQTGFGFKCRMTNPPGSNGCRNPANPALQDESQCRDVLGDRWYCRDYQCVYDYCDYNADCLQFSASGAWYTACVNHRCVHAIPDGDNIPMIPSRPVVGTFESTFQLTSFAFQLGTRGCPGCKDPEPGFRNRNPLVIGNRPVPGTTRPYCPYPEWEGQFCGFVVPNQIGSWIVTVTVTIDMKLAHVIRGGRIQCFNTFDYFPRYLFQMHLDTGGGWFPVAKEAVARNEVQETGETQTKWPDTYIVMSTNLFISTRPGSSSAQPGDPIYAGWSVFWDNVGKFDGPIVTENIISEMPTEWYRITYDITRIR